MLRPMSNATTYIVVDAPGYYGDRTVVLSSHRTAAAALRVARGFRGLCVRESALVKGDTFLRVYEQTSREVRA